MSKKIVVFDSIFLFSNEKRIFKWLLRLSDASKSPLNDVSIFFFYFSPFLLCLQTVVSNLYRDFPKENFFHQMNLGIILNDNSIFESIFRVKLLLFDVFDFILYNSKRLYGLSFVRKCKREWERERKRGKRVWELATNRRALWYFEEKNSLFICIIIDFLSTIPKFYWKFTENVPLKFYLNNWSFEITTDISLSLSFWESKRVYCVRHIAFNFFFCSLFFNNILRIV